MDNIYGDIGQVNHPYDPQIIAPHPEAPTTEIPDIYPGGDPALTLSELPSMACEAGGLSQHPAAKVAAELSASMNASRISNRKQGTPARQQRNFF